MTKRLVLKPLNPDEPRLTGKALDNWFFKIRSSNPPIEIGACLCCGHDPHARTCPGRDFWGYVCGCTTHVIRGRHDVRATNTAIGDYAHV